jgi:hypothetical protein
MELKNTDKNINRDLLLSSYSLNLQYFFCKLLIMFNRLKNVF